MDGNKTAQAQFLKVCLAIKENTMAATHVADIAIVTTISNESKYICQDISSNKTIICTKLANLEIREKDVVVILYCDSDFRQNLQRLKSNLATQEITSKVKHSIDFGVIMGIVYR